MRRAAAPAAVAPAAVAGPAAAPVAALQSSNPMGCANED